METDHLSPAELPFGARVRAVFTKYDGRPHWEYDLVVLGVDEYGVWVGGAPGGRIARPGREFVSDAHWVCLYPHSGMWVATINDDAGTFSSRVYVDVTTPAEWWHRPDGVISVSNVDLDLDVIRRFTGELFVDDEDEFEEHLREMRYPEQLVDDARRTTRWLYQQLERRAEPFEDVCEAWLRECRTYVGSDDSGRAVVVPMPRRGDSAAAGPVGAGRGDGPDPAAPTPLGETPEEERRDDLVEELRVDAAATAADAARPESIAQAEERQTDADAEDEEDLLAVWADTRADEPLVPQDEGEDAGPVVEVDYEIEPGTPVYPEDDYTGDARSGGRVAAELLDVDDIDTSPVDPAEVTGVLVTTETGRESPLWFDGRPVEPEELDLSGELADHLRDWTDRWNRDFDPVRGWAPRATIADYEALGRWLGRRVKDEVGGLAVTVQLAHLGRSSLEEIAAPDRRDPIVVTLDAGAPGELPVTGEFVTLAGTVGCFTSETNARLSEWAVAGGRDADEAEELRWLIASELGDDYRVV